jgi:hypothetical protein
MVLIGNYPLPTYHELEYTLIGGLLRIGGKQVMGLVLMVLISFE